MIVKFDSFNRYEIPAVTLCNPNDSQIGMIDNITGFELVPNFNEVSEITCTVSKYLGDIKSETYDKIKKRRQFLVENFGYFIITNVDEDNVGTKEAVKNVKLLSCEFELDGIGLPYIDGTYVFNDLIDIVKPLIPHWTLDTATIPSSISAKSRTFEDIDTNIYNFLMTSVQESYGCFFDFDIENRAIKVYDKNDYIIHTDILLTNEDVVNSIKCNENTDDMYTAISPTGGNDLNIAYVNPLGTNTIYNFTYYKNTEWMSQDLVDAVTAWENLFQANESAFSALITNLLTKYDELISIQTDVTMTKNELDNANKIKSTTIAENASLTNINSIIASKQIEHDGFVALLNAKQLEIDDLESDKLDINNSLSFSTNFTPDQYRVLCKYISCSQYTDENIIKGTNMTKVEEIQQALELYNSSKELLEKISEPNYEFDVDTESFIFSKEFENYTSQLAVGSLINVQLTDSDIDVETKDEDIASLILLSMPIDFMDGTVSFKFGNRFKLSNQTTLWDDLQNRVAKTAHTVEKMKDTWSLPVKDKNVSFTDLQKFYNGTLDLTKNSIMSTDGQSIDVRDDGIHIRRKLPDDSLDSKEIIITNGTIACLVTDTVTGLQTAKLALGSLTFPDSSEAYGLIASTIYGNLIAGNQLTISSPNGDFIIDKDGVRSTVFDTIENVDSKVSSAMAQTKDDITMTFINGKLSGQTQFTSKGMEVDADGTEGSGINVYNGGIKVYAESKVDVSGETVPVFSVDEDGGANIKGNTLNEIDGLIIKNGIIEDSYVSPLNIDYPDSYEIKHKIGMLFDYPHLGYQMFFGHDFMETSFDGQVREWIDEDKISAPNGLNIDGDYGKYSNGINLYASKITANNHSIENEVVLLWSGSAPINSSVSPVVIKFEESIYNFRGAYITMSGEGTRIFCPIYANDAEFLRGIGAFSSLTSIVNYTFGANIVSNTSLSIIACNKYSRDISTGTWSNFTDRTVTSIVGWR